MGFKETIAELGYELVPCEKPFIKVKKRDDANLADIVIIFNSEAKVISGGLITLRPIKTIDDISHQYTIYRGFDRDIKYFSERLGYDIL